MPRLGTYTTIDCPTKQIAEAFHFLTARFNEIGGKVYQKMNSHDFGYYPSFEVDYPPEMDNHAGDDCETCAVGEPCPLDDWHEKANKIEAEYNKQFADYL